MRQARVIYHLARADFLERVRRYSFLIMLGAVTFLGYQAAIGNINVQVGNYRGEFNSAWVGSMMSIIASFFLGWFGFYLVKGSLARDRETGVGQIMATTPLTRPLYTFGKWVSNFAVLISMVSVLAVAGIGIQFLTGESRQLEFAALLAPFLFIALPMMAMVAALAVLFESIGFLSGGFGNVLYFFLFVMVFPIADALSKSEPAIEPLGFGLLQQSMGAAAKAAFPDYDGDFILGSTDIPIQGVFHWAGVDWTPDIILKRFAFFGIAIVLTLIASLFFDRFDPSRSKPRRMKANASLPKREAVPTSPTLSQPVHLTPLTASTSDITFMRVLISELKLLLKGQRWWWYAVAIGLFIASLINKPEIVRAFILPLAWLWPILIWSGLGNREIQNNTQQMVFSSAAPLWRQLPATWLAGFLVALLTGSGVAIKLLGSGDGMGLLAWISAAIFIPSFALASGVLSNSHKVFEVVYVALWYLGPMNKVLPVDYLGANSNGNIGFFIPLSVALLTVAFIGRARQLQN
ncbi:MAG TPA: ABC transporter permease subunit [Anaerolineales bacterium]|nr:ABC transporter permease subunit [Anaerolineales bacterium]